MQERERERNEDLFGVEMMWISGELGAIKIELIFASHLSAQYGSDWPI